LKVERRLEAAFRLPSRIGVLNISAYGEPELFTKRTMNSNQQTTPSPQSQSACKVAQQAVAILAAAVALGLVYNSASPLGLRLRKTAENPASASAATNVPPARPITAAVTTVTTPPTNPAAAPATSASADFIPVLTWMQVKPLLAARKIVLIDGRTPAAYQVEHIPGAISLSVKLVKEMGFTNVQEMPGGITEYIIFEGKPNPGGSK
jgi:hypothetical protein